MAALNREELAREREAYIERRRVESEEILARLKRLRVPIKRPWWGVSVGGRKHGPAE